MADESRITTIIEWQDTGTADVIRASNAVRDSVVDATEKINNAGEALDSFKMGASGIPNIPLPTLPLPFDEAQVKDAAKSIEAVSQSALDFGEAGEQLTGILDAVIPGLGGIGQALASVNPLALAGTIALTGLTLAVADMQRQAEEAQKAIEAQAKAESDLVLQQIDLRQRTTLALSGDEDARQKILTDLADYTSKKEQLELQGAENAKKIAEQLAIIEEYSNFKPAAGLSDAERFKAFTDAQAKIDEATTRLNTFNQTAEDLKNEMTSVSGEFALLTDAAKEVGITTAEQAAVNKALTVGTDGAVAALNRLWGEMGTASDAVNGLSSGVSDSFKSLTGEMKDMQNAATSAAADAAKAAKERAAAEERLIEINQDLADVEMDRGKALADRIVEDQRAAQFAKLNDHLAAAQAYDAQVARNKKVAEIQGQAHQADIAAQQKYMEDELKLLDDYRRTEKEATEDYNLQRARQVEDLYNTLLDLSSKRDVAGFVSARRAGMTDIARGGEDEGISARRRREQVEKQQADLQAAFAKENATRQAQLQQRLQQEMAAGQQEFSVAAAVQKQIADLRAQYAAQDLALRRKEEDQAFRETQAVLQRKRMAELQITAGTAAGIIDILSRARDAVTQFGGQIGQLGAKGLPKFHEGTPLITRGGLGILKEGESVLNPAETAQRLRSGGQGAMTGPITIQMNVGEIATPSQITAVEERIVRAIERFGGNSN